MLLAGFYCLGVGFALSESSSKPIRRDKEIVPQAQLFPYDATTPTVTLTPTVTPTPSPTSTSTPTPTLTPTATNTPAPTSPVPSGQTWRFYYFAGAQRVAVRVQGDSVPANNGVFYLLADHLGSTALTVTGDGQVLGEMRYRPWGETRYSSGSTPTDYRFTGQREEAGIGLYYYRARWYDAGLGRFAQADTIVPNAGNPKALDRYAYGLNNPVRYSDPSGHCVFGLDTIVCVAAALLGLSMVLSVDTRPMAAWETPSDLQGAIGLTLLGGPLLLTEVPTLGIPVVKGALEEAGEAAATGTQFDPLNVVLDVTTQFADDFRPRRRTSAGNPPEGYIRAVPVDQVGTSQPFKPRRGEDGLSVFEGVSPQQVLRELPGARIPNTTVTIPRDALPPGTSVIPRSAPTLSTVLSDAHRILVRPEGWSSSRFATMLKRIVGWE